MKSKFVAVAAGTIASLLFLFGVASVAGADGYDQSQSSVDVSLMGGVQVLNQNDTSLEDHFVNVPLVGTLTYHLTPIFAAEGEVTWMIPVKQTVDSGTGEFDAKTQDVLAYQANLRANLPVEGIALSPYLVAGAGAVTFLSSNDADRVPALDKSETMFAINFGAGTTYGINPNWGLRADFREFVAFPSNDATGFSVNGESDDVWMERGTLGLVYSF
jgi:opacity protein-like surface antigen